MSERSPESAYTYWAFISYSHADERWAQWLHRSLETYKVPTAIVGTTTADGTVRPRRLFPLFRDRDELSSASSLGAHIRDALNASRNLIVICSPRAVASRWVNEEIRTFQALGRGDRVFCLIVDGEPDAARSAKPGAEECFPAALRHALSADGTISTETAEPLAADARPDRDGRRNALLKLSAGILDVGFDKLKQRDHERRIRQFTVAGAVLSAAVITLAALTYYAFVQKNAAEREARAARAALSGQIASLARIALESFPRRSLLLAVQALRTTQDKQETPVAAAREAILRALAQTGGRVFAGDASPVVAVAVSGDGRWVATASEEGTGARLWDQHASGDPPPMRELRDAAGPVAISANSRWLVTAGRDAASARLWDLTAPDPSTAPRVLDGGTGPFAFTRDNRWLITSGADHAVRVWDLAASTAAPIVLPPEIGGTTVLATSLDSRWLATSSWNPEIRQAIGKAHLWDLTAARPQETGIELKGHTSSVSNIVFSPDGHWLVTSSQEQGTGRIFRSDPHARLWDLTKPDVPAIELRGHEAPISSMAVSGDSRFLVTGSADQTARVWNLTDGNVATTSLVLAGHSGTVSGVAVASAEESAATVVTLDSGAGRTVTGLGSGPVARRWIVETAQKTAVPTVVTRNDRAVAVSMIAPSDDGRSLLLSEAGQAYVLDLLADDPASSALSLLGHDGEISTAAFAPDGRSVITGSTDGTARLWPLRPVQPAATPSVIAADYDAAFALSPDGRRLLTLGGDDAHQSSPHTALLWDLAIEDTAAHPVLLHGHTGGIETMAFSADSAWLATGSADATARLWDLRAADPSASSIELKGHTQQVSEAVFSRDGRTLVTGSLDSTLRVWDLTKKNPSDAQLVLTADNPIHGVRLAAGRRWLAVRGAKSSTLWDLDAAEPAHSAKVLPDSAGPVLVSSDDRWLVTYAKDSARAAILDLRADDVLATRRVLDNAGEPHGFSPDSRWLVTQGKSEAAGQLLWPLAGQAPSPIALPGHTKALTSVSFSADNRWLVTGSYDDTGRIWDLTAKEIAASSRVLSGHPSSVTAAISGNGRWVVTTGFGAAFLWENVEGGLLVPITLPVTAEAGDAAFTANGAWLVTNHYGTKSVSLWRLALDDLMRRACRTAGRNLTHAEWEQYLPGQPYVKTCAALP